jgi:signal transduction histidine kinase
MEHDFILFDVYSWRRHLSYGRIYHYLWAIIFTLFVTWLKLNFAYVGATLPYFFYILSIFLSTYIGGLGPGLLSLLLSVIFIQYLFLSPPRSFFDYDHLFALTAFILEGSIIIYLVTRQRRLLFQKIELDQQKDDFISASSHELNTPLTSMKIYLDLMQSEVGKNNHHQYEEPLSMVVNQTERLIRLVGSLLDITRLKAQKALFRFDTVDLEQCVRLTAKSVAATAPLHKIYIEGHLTKKVQGDEDRLGQVISNLLTNAIKYSPRGGDIFIRLTEKKNEVMISVQDSGIGIEKSKHKKIFERFYRVAEDSESTFSGLGIGLYLAAEIVKKHKGKIWVESEKGKGATFHVILPAAVLLPKSH